MMRRRLLIIGIILIISAVLAILMADFFRQNLIIPIAQFLNRFFWIIRFFIESVDQVIFWISFLIIALIIAGASLFNPARIISAEEFAVPKHKSRIAVWRGRIENLHRGDYFKWRLAKNLGELAIDVIAFRHGISSDQALSLLEEQQLDMADDIRAYVLAGQRSSPLKNDSITIGNRIRSNTSPLELAPDVLLDFLDTQLGDDNAA
jgi:hypothetical protein